MKQEVNLLERLPARQRDYFATKYLVIFLMGFILLLVGIYFFSQWHVSWLNAKNKRLRNQQVKLSADLVKIARKDAKSVGAEDMKKEIKELKQKIAVRNRLITKLKREGTFNITGFSAYMSGLAETIVPNVWLNSIELEDGGEKIKLKGKAFNTRQILLFIKQMHNNQAFKKTNFKLSSLKKDNEQAGQLDFVLQSGDMPDG